MSDIKEELTYYKIDEFVDRNENVLFHINSKITSNDCTAWFVIETEKTNHKHLTFRYKYIGSILRGLPQYFEKVSNESSDNR